MDIQELTYKELLEHVEVLQETIKLLKSSAKETSESTKITYGLYEERIVILKDTIASMDRTRSNMEEITRLKERGFNLQWSIMSVWKFLRKRREIRKSLRSKVHTPA